MNSKYAIVARRANHRCEYCRAPEAIFNIAFEVEHIVPPSRSGRDDESNLALACRSCNLHKSDFLTGLDEHTGIETPLFSPRVNLWTDHFELDHERGELRGLTPSGRATISRLRMNDPVQLIARLLWIQLRLYP